MKHSFLYLLILLVGCSSDSTKSSLKDCSDTLQNVPGVTESESCHNVYLFPANDGVNGMELWRTDGTAEGTYLLKDINDTALDEGSYPYGFIMYNGEMYFSANDGAKGLELWKSDGTTEGTSIMKDISAQALNEGASFAAAMRANGLLFFRANDGLTGKELWRTDGTESGTMLVKDIATDALDSLPLPKVEYNNRLIFAATSTGGSPYYMYESDGTEDGTQRITDKVQVSTKIERNSVVFKGEVYFNGYTSEDGYELWKSDGTDEGTVMVKSIQDVDDSGDPTLLTVMGNKLYFFASSADEGREIWVSDGTESGTTLLKDIYAMGDSSIDTSETIMVATNDKLFFRAEDGSVGSELWVSDGTQSGTQLVKDINLLGDSNIQALHTAGSNVFFKADDGVNGIQLWRSNGTDQGTYRITDNELAASISATFEYSASNGVSALDVAEGNILVEAYTAESGLELYLTNGSELSLELIKDINPGADSGLSLAPDFGFPGGGCVFIGCGEYVQFDGGNYLPSGSSSYSDVSCETLTAAQTSDLVYVTTTLDDAKTLCQAHGFTSAFETIPDLNIYVCSG